MPDETIRDLAAQLRRATHDLTQTALRGPADPDALRGAARLVDEATATLETDISALRGGSYRSRSLFQGEAHLFSPALTWEGAEGPDGQRGYGFRVSLSRLYQGPPGAVHGGYLAGLFDELLGAVQRRAQDEPAYTAKLSVKYRAPTPLDEELRFRGWVVRDSGRRLLAAGSCTFGDTRCADAEALFVMAGSRP